MNLEKILAKENVIGSNSVFDFVPFILVGICLIMLVVIAGVIVSLIRGKKKAAVAQTVVKVEDLIEPQELTVGKAQTIGARENQQDSYSVSGDEQTVLAVVADGMGGLQNGAEISGIVSYVFKEGFMGLKASSQPEVELVNIVRMANEQACGYIGTSAGGQSGSTLVATYIRDGKLYFASVGDSRIYLMRNQQLVPLNREHIYAYELDEKVVNGEMSDEKALSHRERKSLTSYIGMGSLKHVDRNLTPLTLQKDDVILLASDGVFNTLSETEMIEALNKSNPQEAAIQLIEEVGYKAKPGQDNATAVVLFYRRG